MTHKHRSWAGICLFFLALRASATIFYVDVNSDNPTPPFTNWDTAATNIQCAVDLAQDGDEVMVDDGVYQTGGISYPGYTLTNRVCVTHAITLASVNGPGATMIMGYQIPDQFDGEGAVRCVYLGSNAVLSGFTLTNGATEYDEYLAYDLHSYMGGGVCCEIGASVTNCIIAGCSSSDLGGGFYGDGGYGETATNVSLVDCVIAGCNSSSGGGAAGGILTGCTLSNNYSNFGGGADVCVLSHCALAGNSAVSGGRGGGAASCTATDCEFLTNSSDDMGGAAFECTLIDCNVCGNSAGQLYSYFFSTPGPFAPQSSMFASYFGGGAEGCTLNNCKVIGNEAFGGAAGGGADSSTLNNCLVVSNTADFAGASEYSTFNNCTLAKNSSGDTNGVLEACALTNCIIYYNSGGDDASSRLGFCCAAQAAGGGPGNITNEPCFVDLAGGDFHLQSNSPCINSGDNTDAPGDTDLDGNPRIAGGTVDMGAYEYQAPTSIISYAWLQQYSFPTDGSADFADPDADGMNNYQEWIAGTDPTNPLSNLTIISVAATNDPPGLVVTWQSVAARDYFLQSSSDLGAAPPFVSIESNIMGQPGTTSVIDTNATNFGPYFYRVGVQ